MLISSLLLAYQCHYRLQHLMISNSFICIHFIHVLMSKEAPAAIKENQLFNGCFRRKNFSDDKNSEKTQVPCDHFYYTNPIKVNVLILYYKLFFMFPGILAFLFDFLISYILSSMCSVLVAGTVFYMYRLVGIRIIPLVGRQTDTFLCFRQDFVVFFL